MSRNRRWNHPGSAGRTMVPFLLLVLNGAGEDRTSHCCRMWPVQELSPDWFYEKMVNSECSQKAFSLEMFKSWQIFCAAPCQPWADGFWLPDRSCITSCSGHRHFLMVCDAVNSHSLGLNWSKLKYFLSSILDLGMRSPNPNTTRTISMECCVTVRNPLSGHHHPLGIRGT